MWQFTRRRLRECHPKYSPFSSESYTVTFSTSQNASFVVILAWWISTSFTYWKTYLLSLSNPSMRMLRLNMNGYRPSCSFRFFMSNRLNLQKTSSASLISTFSISMSVISRNILGASMRVSVIFKWSEYHRAERPPTSKKQRSMTKPRTCQKG